MYSLFDKHLLAIDHGFFDLAEITICYLTSASLAQYEFLDAIIDTKVQLSISLIMHIILTG